MRREALQSTPFFLKALSVWAGEWASLAVRGVVWAWMVFLSTAILRTFERGFSAVQNRGLVFKETVHSGGVSRETA